VEPSGVDADCWGLEGLRKAALLVGEVCKRCFTPWWVTTCLGFDLICLTNLPSAISNPTVFSITSLLYSPLLRTEGRKNINDLSLVCSALLRVRSVLDFTLYHRKIKRNLGRTRTLFISMEGTYFSKNVRATSKFRARTEDAHCTF
jgi:hypothetical protein